jgi:hypothetical protein
LLLDAAAERRAVRSPGATASVIPFPEKRGKAREAAQSRATGASDMQGRREFWCVGPPEVAGAVGAERVFELVRHLTERDRKIVLRLYQQ